MYIPDAVVERIRDDPVVESYQWGVRRTVAVGIDFDFAPTLGILQRGWFTGIVLCRVEPADDVRVATEPKHTLIVELQMVRAETGVYQLIFVGLWVVLAQLAVMIAVGDQRGLGAELRQVFCPFTP